MTDILKVLLGRVRLTVFLGDACRTNPFGDSPVTVGGARSVLPASPEGTRIFVPRGPTVLAGKSHPVAEREAPPRAIAELGASNLIVAFSTSAAEPALDGNAGGHSPFASALLQYFTTGSPTIADMFDFIDKQVLASTNVQQRPQVWTFGAS